MASDRKIAANRENSKKSTGPRTLAGRLVSSRNARVHGLAVSIRTDPAFDQQIENLARALSPNNGLQGVTEVAREAAEAQIDLLRIRKIRNWIFNDVIYGDDASPHRLQDLNAQILKLERYERRAFSRRKTAIRIIVQV